MAVNVKLGVDLGDFNSGIKSAKEQIKTFDAALKLAEASLKATGDAESSMTTKTEALKGKLEAQKKIVDQYTEAMRKMRESGVDQTSASYQKMQRELLNAQAAMMTTKSDINELNTSQKDASKSADQLATNVGKIGKNVSLQTVADGVSKLTNSLERGARAAIRIGRNIARSAMDSTGYADDLQTRATQYNIDVETLQRMENVAAYIDTDVDAIISARDRMSKNRESLQELLGISTDGKTVDDVFWEAGEAIMNLGEGFDQAEVAQKIFGRSWREMLPLFTAGREEYESMMENQNVLTKEQVAALVAADDAFKSVQQEIELLKNQFWADNADTIVDLLKWIVDNKDSVVAALTAIATGFGLLKVGEFALNLTKIVNGLKDLGIVGGGAGGGVAVGASARGLGGIGGKLLATGAGVGLTGTAAAIGSTLTMLDPTGLTALIPSVLEDQTAFLRTLRNGGSLEEAAAESGKAIEQAFEGAKKSWSDWFDDIVNVPKELAKSVWKDLFGGNNNEPTAEVKVEPKTDEEAAAMISAQIGTVSVPVKLTIMNAGGSAFSGGGGGGGQADYYMDTLFGSFRPGFANGIPWVDNTRLALLHRGERVLTASENRHYTFNNNTYFGSVNMNNGTQVEQLADAIARNNQKQSRAYG